MGWGGGTRVFDQVVYDLKANSISGNEFYNIVWGLLAELEDMDWDNVCESDWYNDKEVQAVVRKMHPHWFEDDE
jgi:hypothetical protein